MASPGLRQGERKVASRFSTADTSVNPPLALGRFSASIPTRLMVSPISPGPPDIYIQSPLQDLKMGGTLGAAPSAGDPSPVGIAAFAKTVDEQCAAALKAASEQETEMDSQTTAGEREFLDHIARLVAMWCADTAKAVCDANADIAWVDDEESIRILRSALSGCDAPVEQALRNVLRQASRGVLHSLFVALDGGSELADDDIQVVLVNGHGTRFQPGLADRFVSRMMDDEPGVPLG